MKKVILICFTLLVFGLQMIYFDCEFIFDELITDDILKITVVSKKNINSNSISCGNEFITCFYPEYDNISILKSKLKKHNDEIISISVAMPNKKFDELKVDFRLININKLNDVILYNCYSDKINKYNFTNGRRFNIQIVEYEQDILIGIPYIYEGF